jgi:trk system potassium uptake protein TrkH
MFYTAGDTGSQAVWRGIFTAVSAFCNAGFALQSDSLMSWHTTPAVLHIVATLIIFGGMAPATSLVIPKWLAGRQVPIPARIALIASIVLLFLGTVFIMAFEWGGLLAGLSVSDKIQNAWFQSVTLRTAGFNSLDIAGIAHPTFLLMIAFMFIGGSPGGTAGGVKTTTIGILAMTFFANITNRREVVLQNRRIRAVTVFRAVTIVGAGLLLWFGVVLMLEVTQPQIRVRDLIFEATSALGTVGLSTGATGLLDEIGKIIIIIAMFCGRIGPVTLFMLLSDPQAPSSSRCPDAKIFLT